MSRSYIWRSIILIIVIIVSLICALYLQKYKLFRKSIHEGFNEETTFGQSSDASGNTVSKDPAYVVPDAPLTAVQKDKIVGLNAEIVELQKKIRNTESQINGVEESIASADKQITQNSNVLSEKLENILKLKEQLAKAKAAEEAAEKELANRLKQASSYREASNKKIQDATNTLKLLPKMNFNNPSNLAACYSVRQVVPSYTGPVVQLRRSSDGNLQDFYSNGKQLFEVNYRSTKWTTAARGLGERFVDWLGNSTAYVSIWYDQSRNGNHAVNDNHDETQPSIISKYGHWVIQFQSGNNTFLNIPKKIGANTIFTSCASSDSNKLLGLVGMSNSANGMDFMSKMKNVNITTYINNSQRASSNLNTINTSIISPIPPNTLNTTSIMTDTTTPAYIDTIGMNMNFTWFDGFVADIILHNTPMTGQDAMDYFNNRLLV